MWLDAAMPNLTVRRDRGGSDRLRRYRILLDGAEVGQLRRGETLSVPVEPGPHELLARIDWCGSRPLSFEVGDADEVVQVRSALRGFRLLFAARRVFAKPDDYLVLEREPPPPPR